MSKDKEVKKFPEGQLDKDIKKFQIIFDALTDDEKVLYARLHRYEMTRYAYSVAIGFAIETSNLNEEEVVERYGKYIEKMNKITKVENLDYTDLILKYDSPTTFFYVDPPYWKTENYYSNHDFDSEDHNTLMTHLKLIKGKFALSYYDFPLLSDWLPKNEYKWEEREFSKAAGATKGKKQNKGTELLIMNY